MWHELRPCPRWPNQTRLHTGIPGDTSTVGLARVDRTKERVRRRGSVAAAGAVSLEARADLGRGFAVRANRGDRIVFESTHVGQPRRQGEVVEVVPGDGGHDHYRVRWEDGHESTYFPSIDGRVVATGEARSNWPLWS